jgi:hypothetical protein
MWPKVVYLYPTLIVSLVCWAGMWTLIGHMADPSKRPTTPPAATVVTADGKTAVAPDTAPTAAATPVETAAPSPVMPSPISRKDRFFTPENLLGVLFLVVFAFNMLVIGLDFPRFTILAVIMGVLFAIFFVLWLGAYFQLDLLRPVEAIFSRIYTVAYPGFYLGFFLITSLVFLVVYLTRWLDYWEILPNEILHHHGPLSDLERYPTLNLKFDKEIPDVFEFLLLGAGKLVLHVPNAERAIVLENVLFINSKEEALKRLMSRLEVRITNDHETP